MNQKIVTTITVIFAVFSLAMISQMRPAYADGFIWLTSSPDMMQVEVVKNNPYYEIVQNMTDEEYDLMHEMVWHEAVKAGCNLEVCEACVQTVFNRILVDKGFGSTVKEVLLKKGQFSTKKFFYKSTIPDEAIELIDDAMSEVARGHEVLPARDYVYFDVKKQSYGKNYVWIGEKVGMWYGQIKY